MAYYENMASVSVYRSYAKCVLGTKTLTLPTQDSAEAWFSWLGQIKNRVPASQCLYLTLLLTEGVESKQPRPYPTSFDSQAWSTHPLLGAIQLYRPRWRARYFLDGHRTGTRRKPKGHVLTKLDVASINVADQDNAQYSFCSLQEKCVSLGEPYITDS